MFSFFCARQASKGESCVVWKREAGELLFSVPDSKHRHTKEPDPPWKLLIRGHTRDTASGLGWALPGKEVPEREHTAAFFDFLPCGGWEGWGEGQRSWEKDKDITSLYEKNSVIKK